MVLRTVIIVLLFFGAGISASDAQNRSALYEKQGDESYMRRDYTGAESSYALALTATPEEDTVRYFKLLCKNMLAALENADEDSALDTRTQIRINLTFAEAVVGYAEYYFGKKSVEYSDALFLYGLSMLMSGDAESGGKAMIASVEVGHEDFPRKLNAFIGLGLAYSITERHDKAVDLLRFVADNAPGPEPLPDEPRIVGDLYFQSRIALVAALENAGMAREAFDIVDAAATRAVEFAEQGPRAAESAVELLTAGVTAGFYAGETARAQEIARTAYDIASRTFGHKDPLTLRALDELADMYMARGMNAQAEQYYIRSLEAKQKKYLFNRVPVARAHATLASFYGTIPNPEMAERHLHLALGVLEKNGKADTPLYEEYNRRLSGLHDPPREDSVPFRWLWAVYEDETELADSLYEPMRIEIQALIDKGNYDFDDVSPLYTAAAICRYIEDYESAHYLIKSAIAVLDEGMSGNNIYAMLLDEHASLHEELGETEVAKGIYMESFNAIFRSMFDNFLFLSESDREAYWREWLPLVKKMQAFCMRHVGSDPTLAAFAYDCQVASKNVLLESGRRLRSVIRESGDAEMQERWSQYERVVEEIEKEKLRLSDPAAAPAEVHNILSRIGIADPDPRLDILEESKRTLEKWFGTVAHHTHGLRIWSTMWTDVRDALVPGEACVEYISCEDDDGEVTYWALVVTPGCENPRAVALGEREELMTALWGRRPSDGPKLAGEAVPDSVYRRLWIPVAPSVTGNGDVYVSLSDELNVVPLDACVAYIQNSAGGPVTRLHNLMSTGDITGAWEEMRRPGSALLFGGMDFWEGATGPSPVYRGQGYDFLPGSLHEVQSAAGVLEMAGWQTTVFIDTGATRRSFLEAVSDGAADIIHISTHGYNFPQPLDGASGARSHLERRYGTAADPLRRTGLLFSGANEYIVVRDGHEAPTPLTDTDDGILSAAEIASLWLPGTGLVVLSACETGLGDIDASEGVYGLQRALRLAGVRSMIVTLYRIPDRETVEFMTAFYTRLVAGSGVWDSFRAARNDLMEKHPDDPRIWAAFKLIE